jgi:hypothetical protein
MRSAIHGPDSFLKKMKKKPGLQHIIDNLHNYTEEDIDKLNQPLWIRKELKRNKKLMAGLAAYNIAAPDKLTTRDEFANLLADLMEKTTTINPTITELYSKVYDVVEWQGSTWQMPHSFTKMGSGSTIDIEYGDLFLLIDAVEHILVFEHRYVKLNDKDFNFFQQKARSLNIQKTIKDYKIFNIERIEKKHGLRKEEVNDMPEIYRDKLNKHPMEHLIDKNQRKIRSSDFR